MALGLDFWVELSEPGALWDIAHRNPDEQAFAGKDDPVVCRQPW